MSTHCAGRPHAWTPDYLNGCRVCRDCGAILLDSETYKSVAIQRLIDEVKVEKDSQPNAYNRVYHRHNR